MWLYIPTSHYSPEPEDSTSPSDSLCQRLAASAMLEIDLPAAAILAARIADKTLDDAPLWSDVRTFPCGLYRGCVAGIIGGFPCTDRTASASR